MSKRKRDEEDDQDFLDQIGDRAIRIKASRLQVRIDQGSKSLKAALQLARGFERQKLGRRQKQASDDPHTLLRLREEVIILKELNAGRTARQYLFKQLVRTKRIKESAAFVALYGKDPKVQAAKSTAESNVLGRLFKANPVKEVLPDMLKDIKNVLGIDRPGAEQMVNQENGKVISKAVDPDVKDRNGEFSGFSDAEVSKDHDPPKFRTESHRSEDFETENEDDNIDYAAYSGRIAASSDDEETDQDAITSQDHDREASELLSISGSDESIITPDPQPKATKIKPAPKSLTSTAFLPSLSMGGYYSGSDSDIDDGFDHDRGPPIKQERKNRRGQRARQLIAEKKFGKEAKHLANQKLNEAKARSAGWDARKGAVGGDDRRRGRLAGRDRYGNRDSGPTGANGDVVNGSRMKAAKTSVRKDDEPLHPSWEAAKKRKEEGGNVAFAGKKITFD